MERNHWIIVAATFGLIMVALVTVWSPTTSGQAPNKPAVATWEYRNVFGTVRQDNADELNRFGKEGWEVCAVSDDGNGVLRFVLKRPTQK
jgi:hypothetical protein